ncbi:DNA topoisomerase I [Roseibacterium elongatum DSM 19469]|uniref:DNA topoisomerase 1 n=1 Tax=Roseicyclus elongatus DSM 19469 TaxID=1294273 RepID=W8SJ67_9RHOB|nr:type I DNA topoisomerase [Roseibacterium elongatum]AHM02535.1 DNA topoisomerase I [Roseibacterium elongatum DSM 19469]
MPVVVVESPAKAKTINKYLGDDYTVLASYGHVRDLPSKDGSVDPDQGFAMEWEVASDSKKHLKAIADALKDDPDLILATDPDREGEAISWHLQEALQKRRALKKDSKVRRVTFNAITKDAVTRAMAEPRDVDMELVEAYLARRALDYLVGFTLSPVLWRKLPGAKSAGRVQSVCLRLVVEREMEIEAFRPREYWSVKAILDTPRGQTLEARLVSLGGKKLDRYDLPNQAEAGLAVQAVASRALSVAGVEAKPTSRNPAPPFMTSTLQQEASRKYGFGAKQTMAAAQRLYEAGHITYMRTDGIDMAPEAVQAARAAITDRFGADYTPGKPRIYKNKAKNAQEAHECIRPTDMSKSAEDIRLSEEDQRKLYDLIWKRTIASQMEAARMERTTVTIASDDAQVELRATGQVVLFDGFLKVYEEGRDDAAEDEDGKRLPQIAEGETLKPAKGALATDFAKAAGEGDAVIEDDSAQGAMKRADAALLSQDGAVMGQQHFTQPPPRYTEASLVKRMEELGIGRPSTYASILDTIQARGYVTKDKGRLIPEDKGRLVIAFLVNYFRRYLEYDYTAKLETELDEVSAGEQHYQDVLDRFWRDFSAAVAETSELRITDVLEKINEVLEPHLFPPKPDGSDPRLCPKCGAGRLSMRTARSGGAFIGCSNYPECRYTRPFGPPSDEAEDGTADLDDKMLGVDPDSSEPVYLRNGRFGWYVQLGEVTEEKKKPPRASLPKMWAPEVMDIEKALRLLHLPRIVGQHPDDGEPIEANFGRYGPYVKHGRIYANLPDEEEVFTVGMNRAVELIAEKAAKRGGRGATAAPLKELGDHPTEGGPVNVMNGRYGPYVKWEKVNATLPKDLDPQDITMERAVELIAEKQAKGGKKKKTTTRARKKA